MASVRKHVGGWLVVGILCAFPSTGVSGATPGATPDPNLDAPARDENWLDRVNRTDRRLNDWLLDHAFVPFARAYNWLVPKWGQARITNLLQNLARPRDFVNSLLQRKFTRATRHLGSLVIDSTVGVAGLFTPSERWILTESPETCGETLGVYGVPMGPYLILPLMGESCIRCFFGTLGDELLDPLFWVPGARAASFARIPLQAANTIAVLMPPRGSDASRWDAFDQRIHQQPEYAEAKRLFRENREFDVSD